MKNKNYEYKCPDCDNLVEFGDKFCKNCSCKLDWDDESKNDFIEEEKNIEQIKDKKEADIFEKSDSVTKNKIIRVINLFLLSFILCMSAYLIGVNSGIYNLNLFGIILATIIDFGLYTFVFMIYPIIVRLKIKDKLSLECISKFKSNSIISAFIIAIIIWFISYQEISAFTIGSFVGYLGRMMVYSIIYFYINKWLFIKNSNSGKNTILSIILLVILIVFALLSLFGYKNNINIDNDPRLKAKHILVDDYNTAKEIIIELEEGKDFCDLVELYSTDSATVDNCGDIGYFEYEEMVEEFSDAVSELKIGEYTNKPVRTDYGYHIIYRED